MRQLFFSFLKIGATTFGGGYAMLPVIRQEVVLTRQWLTGEEFVNVLAVAQSSPGAVAINTAVFIGYKIAGAPGAFAALFGTVLPSFLIILLIAGTFTHFAQHPQVLAAFAGIRPAVAALIAAAVVKLGKPALKDSQSVILTVLFLLLSVYFEIHPAYIITLGALTGIVSFRANEKGEND